MSSRRATCHFGLSFIRSPPFSAGSCESSIVTAVKRVADLSSSRGKIALDGHLGLADSPGPAFWKVPSNSRLPKPVRRLGAAWLRRLPRRGPGAGQARRGMSGKRRPLHTPCVHQGAAETRLLPQGVGVHLVALPYAVVRHGCPPYFPWVFHQEE